MSCGPSGTAHLRDRVEKIESEKRSAAELAEEDNAHATQGHLQAYFDAAMKHFQDEQQENARKAIYPSQRVMMPKVRDAYTPDAEMESVRSHCGRSDRGD